MKLARVRIFIIGASCAFELLVGHVAFFRSLDWFLGLIALITSELWLEVWLDELLLAGHVLSSHLLLLLRVTHWNLIQRLLWVIHLSNDFRLAKGLLEVFKMLLRLAWLEHQRRLILTRLVLLLLGSHVWSFHLLRGWAS